MTSLQKIKALLLASDRRKLMLLLLPMTLTALINIFGIGFVMPFLAVVSSPAIMRTNKRLHFFYKYFGFTQPMHFIIFLGVLALVMLVLADSLAALTTWLSAKVVAKVRARITQALYETYLDKDYEFHLNYNSSTLANNLFNLSTAFTNGYVLQGMQLLSNMISIIAIVGLIVYVSPLMAIMTTVVLGGIYGAIYFFTKKTLDQGGRLMASSSEFAYKIASESFGGIKDIKLKGSESVFKKLLFPHLLAINNFIAITQMMTSMPRFALEVVAFGGVILMILVMLMAGQSVNAILPLAAVYVYSGYRLMPALQQLFIGVAAVKVSRASLDKVYESLEYNEGQAVRKADIGNSEKMRFTGIFEVKNLSYQYKGFERTVLDNINFTVKYNEIVGVIGATGAGKTTLIDVILGLLKPTAGVLSVDGILLNSDEKITSWQKCMGYVPQHIYLSDSSIRDNIAFGEDPGMVSQVDVEKAAKIAAIHDFIANELPDGYDTLVGERGVKLSGGQMQRVGIARALYRKPSMLVLDEATSSLDNQTEAEVMQAIYNMRDNITIIIIAHRLSTVACCDRVFLMDKGCIVDQGKFSDLALRHANLCQSSLDVSLAVAE